MWKGLTWNWSLFSVPKPPMTFLTSAGVLEASVCRKWCCCHERLQEHFVHLPGRRAPPPQPIDAIREWGALPAVTTAISASPAQHLCYTVSRGLRGKRREGRKDKRGEGTEKGVRGLFFTFSLLRCGGSIFWAVLGSVAPVFSLFLKIYHVLDWSIWDDNLTRSIQIMWQCKPSSSSDLPLLSLYLNM